MPEVFRVVVAMLSKEEKEAFDNAGKNGSTNDWVAGAMAQSARKKKDPDLDEENLARWEVQRRLCVSARTLHTYVKRGMPQHETDRGRRFDWKQVLEWYVLYRLTVNPNGGNQSEAPQKRFGYRKVRGTAKRAERTVEEEAESGTIEMLSASAERPGRSRTPEARGVVTIGRGAAAKSYGYYAVWPRGHGRPD